MEGTQFTVGRVRLSACTPEQAKTIKALYDEKVEKFKNSCLVEGCLCDVIVRLLEGRPSESDLVVAADRLILEKAKSDAVTEILESMMLQMEPMGSPS